MGWVRGPSARELHGAKGPASSANVHSEKNTCSGDAAVEVFVRVTGDTVDACQSLSERSYTIHPTPFQACIIKCTYCSCSHAVRYILSSTMDDIYSLFDTTCCCAAMGLATPPGMILLSSNLVLLVFDPSCLDLLKGVMYHAPFSCSFKRMSPEEDKRPALATLDTSSDTVRLTNDRLTFSPLNTRHDTAASASGDQASLPPVTSDSNVEYEPVAKLTTQGSLSLAELLRIVFDAKNKPSFEVNDRNTDTAIGERQTHFWSATYKVGPFRAPTSIVPSQDGENSDKPVLYMKVTVGGNEEPPNFAKRAVVDFSMKGALRNVSHIQSQTESLPLFPYSGGLANQAELIQRIGSKRTGKITLITMAPRQQVSGTSYLDMESQVKTFLEQKEEGKSADDQMVVG